MRSWKTPDRGLLELEQLNDTRHEGTETGDASPLNEVEAIVEGLGLDEVDDQSPSEVCREEKTEGGAFGVRAKAMIAAKGEGEHGKEENLVELGGMAGDAVTEVHSPRERGGRSEGIVSKTSEEAADAAYGYADAKGDGEEISGAGVNLLEVFGDFDGKPAS